MALCIEDSKIARLVDELAERLQTGREVALKGVIEAVPDKVAREETFDQRLAYACAISRDARLI